MGGVAAGEVTGQPSETAVLFALDDTLVVESAAAGRPGLGALGALGARMLRWRVGWRWYAVVLGLPLALHAATAALSVPLGAPAPSLARLGPSDARRDGAGRRAGTGD